MADELEYRLSRSSALCVMCRKQLADGEPYLMVYVAANGDDRLAHGDQRAGFMHMQHLLNIFDPTKIGVEVMNHPLAGNANQQSVRITVSPW